MESIKVETQSSDMPDNIRAQAYKKLAFKRDIETRLRNNLSKFKVFNFQKVDYNEERKMVTNDGRCLFCHELGCINHSDLICIWYNPKANFNNLSGSEPSAIAQLMLKFGSIFEIEGKDFKFYTICDKDSVYVAKLPTDIKSPFSRKNPIKDCLVFFWSAVNLSYSLEEAISEECEYNNIILWNANQIKKLEKPEHWFELLIFNVKQRNQRKRRNFLPDFIKMSHRPKYDKEKYLVESQQRDVLPEVVDFIFTNKVKTVQPQNYKYVGKYFKDLTVVDALKGFFFNNKIQKKENGIEIRKSARPYMINWGAMPDDAVDDTMDQLFQRALRSHYDLNKHHPENASFGDISSTIECLCDLLISALRIHTNVPDALDEMFSWICKITRNDANVIISLDVQPKFAKLHPLGIVSFLHNIHLKGYKEDFTNLIKRAGDQRKAPLSKQAHDLDLKVLLTTPKKDRYVNVKGLPEWKANIDDTALHIFNVNTLLGGMRLPNNHDQDKFDYWKLVAYMHKWCIQGKEYSEPQYTSDIPDFPKTSYLASLVGEKFSGFKDTLSKYVKEDILEGVISQAKTTLIYLESIVGSIANVFKTFSEFVKPLMDFIKLPFGLFNVDIKMTTQLLLCYLAYTQSTSVLIKSASVWLCVNILGIADKIKDALECLSEVIGIDIHEPDEEQFCSLGATSLMGFLMDMFTPENAKMAGAAVAVIICLITGYKCFDPAFLKTQGGAVMASFKNFHFIGAGFAGIGRIATWFSSVFMVAAEWISKNFFGKVPQDEQEKKDFEELLAEFAKFIAFARTLEEENVIKLLYSSKELKKKVIECYEQLQKYELRFNADVKPNPKDQKIPNELRIQLRNVRSNIIKVYNCVTRMQNSGKTRPTPFHIQLFGDPGIGKSNLRDRFVREVHKRFFPTYDLDHMTYADPGTSTNFKDGYNGQPIWTIDDMWKVRDAKEVTEFLSWVSNCPVLVNKAHLEEKVTYFTSTWIYSTTNTPYPVVNDVFCMQAVHRRRHALVQVVCEPKVLDKSTGAFNIELFKQEFPGKSPNDFPHLRFNFFSPLNKVYDKTSSVEDQLAKDLGLPVPITNLTFDEFIQKLWIRYDVYFKQENKTYKNKSTAQRLYQQNINELKHAYSTAFPDAEVDTNSQYLFDVFDCTENEDITMADEFETPPDIRGMLNDEASMYDFEKFFEKYINSYIRYYESADNPNPSEITTSIDLRDFAFKLRTYTLPKRAHLYLAALICSTSKTHVEKRYELFKFYKRVKKYFVGKDRPKVEWEEICNSAQRPTFYNLFTYTKDAFEIARKLSHDYPGNKYHRHAKNLASYINIENHRHNVNIDEHFNEEDYTHSVCDNFIALDPELDELDFQVSLERYFRQCAMTTEDNLQDRLDAIDRHVDYIAKKYFEDECDSDLNSQIFVYNIKTLLNATNGTDDLWACHNLMTQFGTKLGSDRTTRSIKNFAITILKIDIYSLMNANYSRDPHDTRRANLLQYIRTEKLKKDNPGKYKDLKNSEYGPYRENFSANTCDTIFGDISEVPGQIIMYGTNEIPKYGKDDNKQVPCATLDDCIFVNMSRRELENMNYPDIAPFAISSRFLSCIKYGDIPKTISPTHLGARAWIYNATLEYPYYEKLVKECAAAGYAVETLGKFCCRNFQLQKDLKIFNSLPQELRMLMLAKASTHKKTIHGLKDYIKARLTFFARFVKNISNRLLGHISYFISHYKPFIVMFVSIMYCISIIMGVRALSSSFYSKQDEYTSKVYHKPLQSTSRTQYCDLNTEINYERASTFFRNTKTACIDNGNGSHTSFTIFRISGQYIIAPYHSLFNYIETSKPFELEFMPTDKISVLWKTVVKPDKQCYYIPGSDSVLIQIKDFPPASDHSDCLFPADFLSKKELPNQLMATYRDVKDPYSKAHHSIVVKNTSIVSRFSTVYKKNFDTLIECEGNWISGSSGAPVLAFKPTWQSKNCLLGFVSHNINQNCYVSHFSYEDYKKGYDILEARSPTTFSEGPLFCDFTQKPTAEKYINSHIDVLGTVPTPNICGDVRKTNFIRTEIAPFLTSTRAPGILNPNSRLYDQDEHPLKHSINKTGRDVMLPLDEKRLKRSTKAATKYISSLIKKTPQVISFDETITGIPGPGSEPINTKTSPGLPWIFDRNRPGKKDFIWFDDETQSYHYNDIIVDQFNMVMHNLENGIIPKTSWYDFPKDELRPIFKIKKVRSINCDSMIFSLCYRQLFLDLERLLHINSDGNSLLLPGIDINGLHAYALHRRLFHKFKHAIELDVGNWDGHLPPQLFRSFVTIVNSLYEQPLSTPEGRARQTLADHCCFSHVQFNDMVYQTWRGMKSGWAGTTTANTICHFVLALYFWFEICEESGNMHLANLADYLRLTEDSFYGDDRLVSFDAKIIDFFNGKILASKYEKYGWPVTSASAKDKGIPRYVSPYDASILKRKFRMIGENYPLNIVAVLDLDVLKDLSYWIRKQDNMKEQFNVNIYTMLEGLVRHGKDTYNEVVTEVNRALKRKGKELIHFSYMDMLQLDRHRILASALLDVNVDETFYEVLTPDQYEKALSVIHDKVDEINSARPLGLGTFATHSEPNLGTKPPQIIDFPLPDITIDELNNPRRREELINEFLPGFDY